jgi:hypothetical protein
MVNMSLHPAKLIADSMKHSSTEKYSTKYLSSMKMMRNSWKAWQMSTLSRQTKCSRRWIQTHCCSVCFCPLTCSLDFREKKDLCKPSSTFSRGPLLRAKDPLELCLKLIKANTEALIQSIHYVISYTLCLIVSMPYRLSSLLWLVGPMPQGGSKIQWLHYLWFD